MAMKKKSSNKELDQADYALFQAWMSTYANSPSAMTRTKTAGDRGLKAMDAASNKAAAKKKKSQKQRGGVL